jgi:hypothetical protein
MYKSLSNDDSLVAKYNQYILNRCEKIRRGVRIPCSRKSMDQIQVSKVQYANS